MLALLRFGLGAFLFWLVGAFFFGSNGVLLYVAFFVGLASVPFPTHVFGGLAALTGLAILFLISAFGPGMFLALVTIFVTAHF